MSLKSSTTTTLILLWAVVNLGLAAVSASPYKLWSRAEADNTVLIRSATEYCMIVPREPFTNIGDSEYDGGMTSYCSPAARTSDSQGVMPDDFWRVVEYQTGNGGNGGRYAQLTGCINPETLDRLNEDDSGGQYDSSGGPEGKGNPSGSACQGYNHYVELIEPDVPRACLRCCEDPDDCPLSQDAEGCPNVIPGNYFNCE